MIRLLVACLALLLVGEATAGTASASMAGLTKSGSSYTYKSATATAANGAFYTPATITMAGRQITMPATSTIAANAASVAVTAVRLNPAGLVLGLTAQWLLGEGLQWANNTWTKTGQMQPTYSVDGRAAALTQEAACLNRYSGGTVTRVANNRFQCWNSAHNFYYLGDATCASGPAAVWGATGYATCAATQQSPATEADFTEAASHPITDGAAQELARADVAMPVNAPVLSPASVDAYSAPYLDPVSGRMVKELTRVTPDPTSDDPTHVRIEVYQVDAGAVEGQTQAAPAPSTVSNSSNQPQQNIEFPSDYARQGEAATAAQSIVDALGPKLDKITETGADPTDPTQPPGSEFDQAFFQGTFTNLLGWQLPAHTSQCPTSSFDWNSTSYTINTHCQLINDHFSVLASAMAVVWTIVALFILLGA